jgi:hypothetical protein
MLPLRPAAPVPSGMMPHAAVSILGAAATRSSPNAQHVRNTKTAASFKRTSKERGVDLLPGFGRALPRRRYSKSEARILLLGKRESLKVGACRLCNGRPVGQYAGDEVSVGGDINNAVHARGFSSNTRWYVVVKGHHPDLVVGVRVPKNGSWIVKRRACVEELVARRITSVQNLHHISHLACVVSST